MAHESIEFHVVTRDMEMPRDGTPLTRTFLIDDAGAWDVVTISPRAGTDLVTVIGSLVDGVLTAEFPASAIGGRWALRLAGQERMAGVVRVRPDRWSDADDQPFTITLVEGGNAIEVTVLGGGGGSSVTVSDEAPDDPAEGDQWWDTTDGSLNLWVGDPGAWVETNPPAPVQSVNGETGAVLLDADDVGADPAGTAAGLIDGLATVATSGDYSDLTGQPVIPSSASEITVDSSPWGGTADKVQGALEEITAGFGGALGAEVEARIDGDAATLAAAQSYVDSIDQVQAWMDRLVTSTVAWESWLTTPYGALADGSRAGMFEVALTGDATADGSIPYATAEVWLTPSETGDTATLTSRSVIQPVGPGLLDATIVLPVGGGSGSNLTEVKVGFLAVDVVINTVDPSQAEVTIETDNGAISTGVVATIAVGVIHQIRIVSGGGSVWTVFIDGSEVWSGSTSIAGLFAPVRIGIEKLSGSTARPMVVHRVGMAY